MNATKINLEDFMIQASKESGLSFYAFHAALRIINDRRGRTLYQEIKNGDMPVSHLVMLLKKFGA